MSPEFGVAYPPASTAVVPPKQGIGGWLLFFLVTTYLGGISLGLQVFRSEDVTRTLLLVLMFTLTLVTALFVHLRSRLIFFVLWATFATRLVLSVLNARIIWSLRHALNYPDLTHDVTNQVGSVAVLAVWLLYFHFSKRVRNTFGQNL